MLLNIYFLTLLLEEHVSLSNERWYPDVKQSPRGKQRQKEYFLYEPPLTKRHLLKTFR